MADEDRTASTSSRSARSDDNDSRGGECIETFSAEARVIHSGT